MGDPQRRMVVSACAIELVSHEDLGPGLGLTLHRPGSLWDHRVLGAERWGDLWLVDVREAGTGDAVRVAIADEDLIAAEVPRG